MQHFLLIFLGLFSFKLYAAPPLSYNWTPETGECVAQIVRNVAPETHDIFLEKLKNDSKIQYCWQVDRHPITNLLAYLADNGWENVAIRMYESYWDNPSLLTQWTGYSWGTKPATGADAVVYEKLENVEKRFWLYQAHLFVTSHERDTTIIMPSFEERVESLKETIKQFDSSIRNDLMLFLGASGLNPESLTTQMVEASLAQHNIANSDEDTEDLLALLNDSFTFRLDKLRQTIAHYEQKFPELAEDLKSFLEVDDANFSEEKIRQSIGDYSIEEGIWDVPDLLQVFWMSKIIAVIPDFPDGFNPATYYKNLNPLVLYKTKIKEKRVRKPSSTDIFHQILDGAEMWAQNHLSHRQASFFLNAVDYVIHQQLNHKSYLPEFLLQTVLEGASSGSDDEIS